MDYSFYVLIYELNGVYSALQATSTKQESYRDVDLLQARKAFDEVDNCIKIRTKSVKNYKPHTAH